MPNIITTEVLLNDSRHIIIKINIVGGEDGEETNTVIYDASALGQGINNKLRRIDYCLDGFSADLKWDATANVPLITLAQDSPIQVDYDFCGGINNSAGTGKTGDILLTTNGLASTTLTGHIILCVDQKTVV